MRDLRCLHTSELDGDLSARLEVDALRELLCQLRLEGAVDRVLQLLAAFHLGDLVGQHHTVQRDGAGVGDDVAQVHGAVGLDRSGILRVFCIAPLAIGAADVLLHLKLRRVRACRCRRSRQFGRAWLNRRCLVRGARDNNRGRCDRLVDVLALRGSDGDLHVTHLTRLQRERSLGREPTVDVSLNLGGIRAGLHLVHNLDTVDAHVTGVADAVPDLNIVTRFQNRIGPAVDALLNLDCRVERDRLHRGFGRPLR